MAFCTSCGNSVGKNHRFCKGCGEQLQEQGSKNFTSVNNNNRVQVEVHHQKPKSNVAFQFIIIGTLLIIAGFFLTMTGLGAILGIPLMLIGGGLILVGLLPVLAPLLIILIIIAGIIALTAR